VKNRGNDPTSNLSRHETKGHLHWYLFQELTTPVTKPLSSSGKAREGSERKRQRSELEVRDHDEAETCMSCEGSNARKGCGEARREARRESGVKRSKEGRSEGPFFFSLSIYRWFPLNLCVSLGHSPPLKSCTSLPADESPTCLWEPS
jgi:hypothetical protein